jgi:hypothetical protein
MNVDGENAAAGMIPALSNSMKYLENSHDVKMNPVSENERQEHFADDGSAVFCSYTKQAIWALPKGANLAPSSKQSSEDAPPEFNYTNPSFKEEDTVTNVTTKLTAEHSNKLSAFMVTSEEAKGSQRKADDVRQIPIANRSKRLRRYCKYPSKKSKKKEFGQIRLSAGRDYAEELGIEK